MSPRIRKTHFLSEFVIIDQKALLHFLNYEDKRSSLRRKAPLLNCVCGCSRMAVEWGLAEEIFSVKIYFLFLQH